MRAARAAKAIDIKRDRDMPQRFGQTTMLASAPKKAGQQMYANVRLGRTLAQRGVADPQQASQLCGRIVKVLDELYVSVDELSSEPPPSSDSDAALPLADDEHDLLEALSDLIQREQAEENLPN